MKLSEMNTKQLAGALCALTQPMSRIATDDNLSRVFANIQHEMERRTHMSMMEKTGMLLEAVPILLRSHYDDTIAIISIMTGKSIAEVEAQNGMEMIDELRKSIDSQFLSFFRSSAAMAQTAMVKGE